MDLNLVHGYYISESLDVKLNFLLTEEEGVYLPDPQLDPPLNTDDLTKDTNQDPNQDPHQTDQEEANEGEFFDEGSVCKAFDVDSCKDKGEEGRSGSSNMGKSSRAPSPKKLVVDEVLPPGHPMPPPRGSLRYHPGGGGGKSSIPRPGGGSSSSSHLPGRCRSSTPVLEAGRMSPRQSTPTPSAWCDQCRNLLVDLKRQALRIYKIQMKNGENLHNANQHHKEVDIISRIEERLHLPDGNYNRSSKPAPWCDTCELCQTQLSRLKQEAINMVQSLDRSQVDSPIPPPSSIPPPHHHHHHQQQQQQQQQQQPTQTKNGVAIMPRTTPHYSSAHHRSKSIPSRLVRQGAYGSSRGHGGTSSPPVGEHHKHYGWASAKQKHINQMLANQGQLMNGVRVNNHVDINGGLRTSNNEVYNGGLHSPNMNGGVPPMNRPMLLPLHPPHYPTPQDQRQCLSPASTTSNGSGTSAAASFFARAAQKLNISSRKKRKHHGPETHEQPFPTNFCEIIYNNPPPAPPVLLRYATRPTNPGSGKVKVMLRICPVEGNNTGSFLSLDARKKQVTVYDPSINGYTTAAHRQRGVVAAPKMFAFDTIFSEDDSLSEMCATGLTDIIQAVVNGADGCLFCYGHARLGKTYTMIGVDDHPQNLGLIPCAIAWLFKLINEQKEKTGARFSVRVSAVEVTGKNEQLKDLLLDVAHGMEAGSGTAPGVYLRDDPISGTQLENQSELRAPTGDRAAHYLDAAVAARTVPEVEEDARNSHMLFTLHVYQYRVEKGGRGSNGVAGGRSRLHLVDLGSCGKSKDGSQALSLSALGNVILALLNGQRHVPHRESKLTQLMRDSLGNLSCRTCMIAHVSPAVQAYNETLQVIQLAARIHRMKRRRTNKFSSTSSESGSSCDESGHMRRRMRVGIRMGTLREDAMSMSDPDYTSSSEQSCDTVIYCGPNGQPLSDRELTDNEAPPRMVPIRPRMGRSFRPSGSRSSGDESSSSVSDFRLGKPPVPKCGTMANSRLPMKAGHSPPVIPGSPGRSVMGSPVPGVVQLPRKLNIKGKQASVNGHDPSLRTAWSKGPYREQGGAGGAGGVPEQWIDGPGVSQQNHGEQWVDGPDSLVYQPPPLQPMPAGEQWIDGPVLRPPGSQWMEQGYQQQDQQQQGYQNQQQGYQNQQQGYQNQQQGYQNQQQNYQNQQQGYQNQQQGYQNQQQQGYQNQQQQGYQNQQQQGYQNQQQQHVQQQPHFQPQQLQQPHLQPQPPQLQQPHLQANLQQQPMPQQPHVHQQAMGSPRHGDHASPRHGDHSSPRHGDRHGDHGSPRHGDHSSPRHGEKHGDHGSPRHGDHGSPRHGDHSSPRHGDHGSPRHGDHGSPRHGDHESRSERIKKQTAQSKAIPASEQWVDGPAEFLVESQAAKPDRPTKMWTEMGGSSAPGSPKLKPAPPPRAQSLKPEEQQPLTQEEPVVAGVEPTVVAEPNHNDVTKPCLPLRHPVLAHIAGGDGGARPASQISTDSCTSVAAQVSESDSRPVSLAGIEVTQLDITKPTVGVPTTTETQQLPGANVKSFVRDWVEKHSVIQEPEPPTDTQSFRSNDPTTLNEMLFGKNAVPLETSSQPSSARSSPRIKKRLRKGALPPPIDHPMNRTAAWIVSVQNAGTETEDMVVSPPDETLHDPLLAPECDQDYMRVGPPPTYEDCMVGDEEIVEGEEEQQEGHEEEVLEVVDQECQVSIHTAENEEQEAAQGGIIPQVPTTPDTLDNIQVPDSVPSGTENGIDISNLLISNRESIYELQMDETLECPRGPDGSWPNTFTSEDDMSGSDISRKNENVCEIYEVMNEVENVEIPSPSHYDEGVVGDLLVNMEKRALAASSLPHDPHMSPLSVNADNESGIASSNGTHPSPPSSSSDSDKHSTGNNNNKQVTRPTCLRKPDGASNPELNIMVEKARDLVICEESDKVLSSPEPLALPMLSDSSSPTCTSKSTMSDDGERASPVRTEGEGQGESPTDSTEDVSSPTNSTDHKQPTESVESGIPVPKTSKKLPVKSGLRPPVPVRTSSRPSILPKPNTRPSSSTSSIPSASSPSSIPSPKSGSAATTPAKSPKSETTPKNTKPDVKNSTKTEISTIKSTKTDISPSKSVKTDISPSKSPKAETPTVKKAESAKTDTKSAKPEKSASRSPFRFGSKSKIAAPKVTPPKATKSGGTSPTKPVASSTLQSKASKEKSNKLSQKSGSSPGAPLPRTTSSKSVPTSVQSMTSRLTSSLSRLPTSSKNKDKSPTKNTKSKIPSPGKKESKLPVSKVSNSRVSELNGIATNGRATDSDSGNDSGIVKNEKKKKFLSPYSTVTPARNSTHSSSGHGSDNSSTFSGQLVPGVMNIKGGEGHHSSGYESMMRDSEATASSSTQDSTSEGSNSGRTRGPKIFKKKAAAGTRRSRSAPPRTTTDEPESPTQHVSPGTPVHPAPAPAAGPVSPAATAPGSPARAWVDTRQIPDVHSEPIEITVYDVHHVERMQRRRKEDAEMRALEKRRTRIRELVAKQQKLKLELAEAKDMLMIDPNTWSYDLYVAEQMDRDDPNYLEALEKETSILEKRVEACKSRIMVVTCFNMGV